MKKLFASKLGTPVRRMDPFLAENVVTSMHQEMRSEKLCADRGCCCSQFLLVAGDSAGKSERKDEIKSLSKAPSCWQEIQGAQLHESKVDAAAL